MWLKYSSQTLAAVFTFKSKVKVTKINVIFTLKTNMAPLLSFDWAKIKEEMTPPRVCFKASIELVWIRVELELVYQRHYALVIKIK